jgi:hypothetical protein
MATRRDHPILETLGLLVLFGVLVLISPGALVVFVVEHTLQLSLDLGQRWTFAVAVSLVVASVFCLRSRSRYGWDGAGAYTFLAVLVAGFVFVARWGFHSPWAAAFIAAYMPR